MELVYLWVEGYKNIEKQGFNFSPRFRCEYDEVTKELNIIDKDETGEFYPKNFFGDNINITAIVGENGSGKSSLVDSIIGYINEDTNILIYRIENKFYCVNQSNLKIEFLPLDLNIEFINPQQSGKLDEIAFMFYTNNLFRDNVSLSSAIDITLRNSLINLKEIKDLSSELEFTKTINIKMKKLIFLLLKSGAKSIPSYYEKIYFLEKRDELQDIAFMPSQGEIEFLFLLSSIYFYLKPLDKDIQREHKDYFNNLILFLDEPTNSYHPQWQKKFIFDLNKFLKDNFKDSNFHIIITSHSPFILSDLPKQNVIFLEKDEKTGNCMNATDKIDINPFGANIHTLLSHGFFMKDGLMGEFAKSKIDDVINYLNNKESEIKNDEDAQNIIDIIGEPIIKRELQRMLKNKMELSNKTEIDTIKNEIKLLTKRLEDLEKDEK